MAATVRRSFMPWLYAGLLSMLAACGGGGGGSTGGTTPPPPPPPTTVCTVVDSTGASINCDDPFWGGLGGNDGSGTGGVDGTSGDGAAIVGGAVTLTDINGKTATAVTDSQGYYRINATAYAPPFVVKVTKPDGSLTHHAFVKERKLGVFTTINVTGLTDKLASDLAVANGKSGARDLTPAMVAATPTATIDTIRAQLNAAIKAQLEAAKLDAATFNPVSMFFRPNLTGHDLVLETVAVYLDGGGATQIAGKSQSACTTPRLWIVSGNQCEPTTTPGLIASGASLKLVDSSGALIGTAEFSCNNGTLSPVGTPTCDKPPEPAACTSVPSSWTTGGNTCAPDTPVSRLESGATLTLTDSQGPATGSVSLSCSNGTLTTTASTCITPRPCEAPQTTWTVAGQTCQAEEVPGQLASGGTFTLTDRTGVVQGDITYSCNNGQLTGSAASCAPLAGSCAAPAAAWSLGGQTCTADVAPTEIPNGKTLSMVDSIGPSVGNVTWACNNGTLSPVSIAYCAPQQQASCPAPSAFWQVNGAQCTADAAPGTVESGKSITLTDTSQPVTGSATYTCENGSLALSGPPSCKVVEPLPCDTAVLRTSGWTVDGATCTADSAPDSISSGATIAVNDTLAPTTGNRTVQCTNGKLSDVGTATCKLTTQQSCNASGPTWSVGGNTCQADAPVCIALVGVNCSNSVVIASGSFTTWFDTSGTQQGQMTQSCTNGVLATTALSCNAVTPRLLTRAAAGFTSSYAIDSNGGLWSWGTGALGDARTGGSSTPAQIGSGYVSIAAGQSHAVGLKSDGTVWTWGSNSSGQLGDGTQTARTTPRAIGGGFIAVASGQFHSFAIKSDGSLYAWGDNSSGQLGDGTTTTRLLPTFIGTGFTSVAGGDFHSVGVKSGGTLWAWGLNNNGALGQGKVSTVQRTPMQIDIAPGFATVSAGAGFSMGVKTDGTLYGWGSNQYGQLGDGTSTAQLTPKLITSLVSSVAAGYNHTLLVKTDGSLWATGLNAQGQLGDGGNTSSPSFKRVGVGYTLAVPSYAHSLTIRSDSSMWSWGSNAAGQLGDGTKVDHWSPIRVTFPAQ